MTAKTVYLHIGPLKSGTSYLQSILQANIHQLATDGVLFPRGSYAGQVRSVLDLLDRKVKAAGKGNRGQWDKLVEEVRGWSGDRAVISQEFLCTANQAQVRRVVASLAPATVHVIYTARGLTRVIPGAWQTLIRNRRYLTFGEFLTSVRHSEDKSRAEGAHFWRQQDPAQVLSAWETQVPRERITVVTVPPPGAEPELLWQRFCQACGLEPSAYDTAAPRRNSSLGAAEAEALRRVNQGVHGRMPRKHYVTWVKRFLIGEVLMQRPDQIPLELPPRDYSWVSERSADMVGYLTANGYQVIGDVGELLPPQPETTPVVKPEQVDARAVLEVTIDGLVQLLADALRPGAKPPSGNAARANKQASHRRG